MVPGEWQPTPGCPVVNDVLVGANLHWRNVAPFGVRSVNHFLLPPPPGLGSSQYAKDLAEVARVGLDTLDRSLESGGARPLVSLFRGSARSATTSTTLVSMEGFTSASIRTPATRSGAPAATEVIKSNLRPVHP